MLDDVRAYERGRSSGAARNSVARRDRRNYGR
jgi:hypothetical protein